jgi:hypothetical protein
VAKVVEHEQAAVDRIEQPKGWIRALVCSQLLDRWQLPRRIANLEKSLFSRICGCARPDGVPQRSGARGSGT